jgi:hypothetical protein
MATLTAAVDKDSADYLRTGYNTLWDCIRESVVPIFGPLAAYAAGRIQNDEYLTSCYIQDFADHSDEKRILGEMASLIAAPDLTGFYSDFRLWVEKHRRYLEGTLGHYGDFKLVDPVASLRPRMLCGRRGSGKTSLLLFATKEAEGAGNLLPVFINLTSPSPSIPDPLQLLPTEIIHAVDSLIVSEARRLGMSDDSRIQACFEETWHLHACYPSGADNSETLARKQRDRAELMRILATQKYTHDFIPYLKQCVEFLAKQCKKSLVLIIDDVDRLDSHIIASAICHRAIYIAGSLSVPVIVSIREETLGKLADVPGVARNHVIPPSFGKALRRRLEVFIERFRMPVESEQKCGYSTEAGRTFVEHIVNSVLRQDVYANLVAFHYDLDILLDIVRCLISSSYLEPQYVLHLAKCNEAIPWHVILNCMQLYVYRNFYDENSFLLNMYDNDERDPQYLQRTNSLVRIRLLQLLRHEYPGMDKYLSVGKLLRCMKQLGYSQAVVVRALQAFARHRLIVTGRHRNSFSDDVDSIGVERTVVYYLDHLIYTYRYIQNILAVTPVDFSIGPDLIHRIDAVSGDLLQATHGAIDKFILFIAAAEQGENALPRDRTFFAKVTRGEQLSVTLKRRIEVEKTRMRSAHGNGHTSAGPGAGT